MNRKIALLVICVGLIFACSKDDSNSDSVSAASTVANKQITGSSSKDLLSDKIFKSLVVEVVYVDGFEPTTAAINNLVSFIDARTFKPSGITVVKRAIPSPGKAAYSIQDIVAIEDANRTKFNTSSQIAVWALFMDGESSNNSGQNLVLGTAYRNTSFVIFEKSIKSLTNSPFKPSQSLLETTVMLHEFGHILGLTNLGAPLQSNHEDAQHAKHCIVESCLMYWQSESSGGIDNMISGGTAPKLDAQCLADLKANGGK